MQNNWGGEYFGRGSNTIIANREREREREMYNSINTGLLMDDDRMFLITLCIRACRYFWIAAILMIEIHLFVVGN